MATATRAARRRIDKLVVTHRGALKAKYGPRLAEIDTALAALVAADLARGLRTRVIALDDARALAAAKGKPMARPDDERAAKRAIDALHRHHAPHYLMILGASDVVPHVQLENPINERFDPDAHDDDETVPSDLPYACEAGYSTRPERFLGPTRVVGRLPDAVAATQPDVLLELLARATAHVSRPRADYAECFALSARLWQHSTALSLENLFGSGRRLHTSPKEGPVWRRSQLAPRVHFINCHGNTLDPSFTGEYPVGVYFEAHRSRHLRPRVSEGAVVAAECCYGAELYDPAESAGEPGLCMAYLQGGAYGFFGSSCIAYGPAEGNGQADLVCQYAVEAVLKGASLGRAMLEARQRFVAQYSHQDPADLKTLLQFLLLGDPSIHPVQAAAHSLARSETIRKAIASKRMQPAARDFRRERLARTGRNLAASVGAAVALPAALPKALHRLLVDAAEESGLVDLQFRSWRVAFPSTSDAPLPGLAAARRQRSLHAVVGRPASASSSSGSAKRGTASAPRRRLTIILATLEGDTLVHLRRVHSR